MRGKLIVIEGTDCSGKETQSKKLIERLVNDGKKIVTYSFPFYDTPTGKIIGGPYLGKSYICNGWFKETAPNVDPKVSALYFAADRKYNIDKIIKELNNGVNVILDRYVYSNMAHQGGKISNNNDRVSMYKWLETLEFSLLELPIPDIKIFLHMPYAYSLELKKDRKEELDENEKDKKHLLNAETAYLEIAKLYDFYTIECVSDNKIKSIDDINDELYTYMNNNLDI